MTKTLFLKQSLSSYAPLKGVAESRTPDTARAPDAAGARHAEEDPHAAARPHLKGRVGPSVRAGI